MQIYQGFENASGRLPPCVLAIGNFDGIHLGHLSLLKRARELAAVKNVSLGVYTFWPHPQSVLHPLQSPPLLCTRLQKRKLLQDYGVEQLIEEPFTPEFATRSAESFATDVMGRSLKPSAIVTGENFRFGNRALGTPLKMKEWLKPFVIDYEAMTSLSVNGQVCSSTKIREQITQGLVTEAAALLGRNCSIVGSVVKGAGRGQTIGIPTANLKCESTVIPATGVYATRAQIAGNPQLYLAATNIGNRPTFSGSSDIHIEAHILDFTGDIYGQELEIFFVKKIRDERKFASPAELMKRIHEDIEIARVS